jgi:hypothetical protein
MIAEVDARSASSSAEQLTAKPQEETAVELELVRIAAEFAKHGIASVGGLLGDLGTLLGDDLQRWLHGEEELAEAEAVEEEAPEAPHACPICCVQVKDHEEPASFACCQKTLYHADCVRKARRRRRALSSLCGPPKPPHGHIRPRQRLAPLGWMWREGTSGYTAPARELGTELRRF